MTTNPNADAIRMLRRIADLLETHDLPNLLVHQPNLQVPTSYGDEATRRALVDELNDLLGVQHAEPSLHGVYAPRLYRDAYAYTGIELVPALAVSS